MSYGVIGISTPEQGRFSLFYASFLTLQQPANTVPLIARGAVISENRNAITQQALEIGADWVLYLDDDHVLPPCALMDLLSTNKDVISALYTQRQPPFNPVLMDHRLDSGSYLWKQMDSADRGIIKVAAAGAGCLLVRRKVLEALKPPYWTLGQINPASWGDDLDFCRRVTDAGFDIYCHTRVAIGHIMSGVVWPLFDEQRGWVANFGQDVLKPAIASWNMPLPGDV